MKQKTFVLKKADIEQPRPWHLIDADGQVLGRLATQVATLLRGKHKPTFTPFLDSGDQVVVINADKIVLTGRKLEQKVHYRHSGYPGGLREITYQRLMREHPDRVVMYAVRGMLPKNRLGRKLLKKLRIYAGPDHPHQAQKPEPYSLTR